MAKRFLMGAYDKLAAIHRKLLKDKYHDQISISDILTEGNEPKDLEYLIVRYLIRWCLEAVAERGREDVDRQFLFIYWQICASHLASDAILENEELREAMTKLDKAVFKRKSNDKKSEGA